MFVEIGMLFLYLGEVNISDRFVLCCLNDASNFYLIYYQYKFYLESVNILYNNY